MVALLAAGAWLGSGCQSPKGPGGSSLAFIVVKASGPLAAARTVSEVFQEAGYRPVPQPPSEDLRLVFEKPGGSGDTLLYGDFHGRSVWYKVRVHLEVLDGETILLSCNAFRVLDHGDAHFETEQRLSHARKGECRALLAKVKARLEASADQK
jgi:hypothetical protein